MAENTTPFPESTRDRLTEAADEAFLRNGAIPIAFGDVSEIAGVSRALVYSHFSSPEELVNAVLSRHTKLLQERTAECAPPPQSLHADLKQSLDLYFDHLCKHGPILHLVSQDAFMTGKFQPDYLRLRNQSLTRLTRKARHEMKVRTTVALSLVTLAAGVAEEAARLVRAQETSRDIAHQTMQQTVDLMLDGLKPETGSSAGATS